MKAAVKIVLPMLLLSVLAGCTPADEMLIGQWKQVYALERVANETTGEVTIDTLPGFDTHMMIFMANATCLSVDRSDTVLYQWALSGNTLALWRDGWAEDYTVNKLTKEYLVYNDTYSYFDSITGCRYKYKYRFEYKKL